MRIGRCFAIAALAAASTARAPGSAVAAAAGQPEPGPRPTLTLSLADPSPIIGVSGETELRIVVADPPDATMPLPRVVCSVGQIEDLGRESPSSFTARYILPSGRFPQPAIVVAEVASSRGTLRGWVPVRLRAVATPSFRTDPGAQVTLQVEDREFGPQVAAADGVVRIPVVVPPGVEFAKARSVNHGKATEQLLDLRVPYSQRVLIVPPQRLAAGTVGEVAAYAVEPSGRAADAHTLVMRASGARAQPLGSLRSGEARFLVSAPAILRDKYLRLEAQIKGQSTTRVAALVPLVPATPVELSLEPEGPRLRRDGRHGLRVFLNAEDGYGNAVDAHLADVLIDGRPTKVESSEDGGAVVVIAPAPPTAAPRDVVVEGVLGNAHAERTIAAASRRARLDLAAEMPPRYTLTPRLGFLWNLGVQTGASLLLEAAAYRSNHYPNFGVGLSVGAVTTAFEAASAAGTTRTLLTTLPALFEIHQRFFARHSPLFVGLGAGAGFAVCFGRMVSFGQTVTGVGFGAALDAFAEIGAWLGSGQVVLSARYLGVFLDELSSGDRINGNAAGAIADLGYRWAW